MANSILKLKVESSEYDQKLANAAKGIRHLADVAHKGAGELTGLEKSEVDYIRALGDMETKSRSASGQLRELSSTYKELKVIYDQLNEVEKADEGGKALAASLETLRTRAQEAKAQLDSASQSLQSNGEAGKGTSGILEVLKDKFTINIDALTLFNKGLQAAEVALNVAKDAFFASEATVDEWGRIVDSSKSLYEGFLTALNTGDISGYLGRIDEIVNAARTAYNELDRLGTMKTIQAPKMSAQQTENERMRMMIQTGRYIAPVDGRRASMKDGQLLTPEQIRRLEVQLQNGMKTVVSLVGNEVKQTGKAIDAVYNRQAKELGLSLSEFRKGTSSMAEFDKRMAGYEQYQKWREQHTTIDLQSGRETVARGNPFEQFAKWGTFRVDGQRYNDLVRLIQQRDQQAAQAYGMQSQAYRTMNRAEGVTVSKLMRGETTGGATGGKTEVEAAIGSIDYQTKKVQELQKAWQAAADDDSRRKIKEEIESAQAVLDNMTGKVFDPSKMKQIAPTAIAAPKMELTDPMGTVNTMKQSIKLELKTEAVKVDETTLQTMLKDAVQNGINGMDFQFNAIGEKIGAGLDVPDSAWEGILEQYNALREQIGLEPITIEFKTGGLEEAGKDAKSATKDFQQAASAIGSVGSALSSIEDPGAKVAGIVAQAIATVASAFASALGTDTTTKSNIWAFIAAAAASTATMISTIASIHSATGYANGGQIKGNSYSGDNILGMVDGGAGGFVGLNAGEIVLNQAQTANVANALEGGGMRGIDLSARVNGEQIVLVANRYFRRTGQGEIVTWK